MTDVATLPEPAPQRNSVTLHGMTVSSNSETSDSILENFEAQEKPKDGPEEEEVSEKEEKRRKRISKAARELGKARQAARAQEASTSKDGGAKKEPAEDEDSVAIAEAEKLEKEGKLGHPRTDPRARMLQATRKAQEAKKELEATKARAEAAERRAREIEARLSQPPPAVHPSPGAPVATPSTGVPGDDPLPDRGKFAQGAEGDAQWLQEFHAHAARQAARMVRSEFEARELAKTRAQNFGAVNHAVDQAFQARDKVEPGWEKRVAPELWDALRMNSLSLRPGEALTFGHVLGDHLRLSMDLAPELMLYLSEHKDELQRIGTLPSEVAAAMELRILTGVLRKTQSAAPTATAPKAEVSKAKPPVRPVTGSPHATDDEPTDDSSVEDFIKKSDRKVPWRGIRAHRR